jgi:ATP-dependent HslUV protease subunit HslV
MTTILAVRHGGSVALGGDGQVTQGGVAVKHEAVKVRRLHDGKVLAGFAGFLKKSQGNVVKASVELAKEWRSDRLLRRLESLLLVADREHILLVSGQGDVIEPDDGVAGIGSGGPYAVAAARALAKHSKLGAGDIVRESLGIAARLCIHTNDRLRVEEL